MITRLIGVFLLQLSVGLLLGVFAVPWWLWGGAIVLITATVDLNTDHSSGKTTGGTLSLVFFLAMMPVMILAIGMLLLNMLALVWLTQLSHDYLPGGATLSTVFYLMLMAGIGDWMVRAGVSGAADWLWLPSVGIANLWALSLTSWQTTPEWVLTAESTLRWARISLEGVSLQGALSFLYQSAWFYTVADLIAAFCLAWVVGIFGTVPPAKQLLLQRWNLQQTTLTLLAISYAGVGAGWLLGRVV